MPLTCDAAALTFLRRDKQAAAASAIEPGGVKMIKGEKVGDVYRICMARSPVNAFDSEFINAWNREIDAAEASGCSVLHVRSSEKVFSAGADLKMMRAVFADSSGASQLVAHVKRMQDLFDRIEATPLVTLAELSGAALGGGFELALACDLRAAAEEAVLGLPEARIGLIPGAGGTQRLTRLCGASIAKRVVLGCDTINGKAAALLGIVQWTAPRHDLSGFCDELARKIAQASGAALAASKRCMSLAQASIGHGLDAERAETELLLGTVDTKARISAFLDARSAA